MRESRTQQRAAHPLLVLANQTTATIGPPTSKACAHGHSSWRRPSSSPSSFSRRIFMDRLSPRSRTLTRQASSFQHASDLGCSFWLCVVKRARHVYRYWRVGRLVCGQRRDLAKAFGAYLSKRQIGHFYWALNPTSRDTGGLVLADWHTPNEQKLTLLKSMPATSVGMATHEHHKHGHEGKPSR